eukprot:750350-Prorocentrum_minimum.AAC.4
MACPLGSRRSVGREYNGRDLRREEGVAALMGEGGVGRHSVDVTGASADAVSGSLGCCVHPCRYWHRRTRDK